MSFNDTYQRTYNSFCGVDIVATFGEKLVGELQGISFTVSREKAPNYTMGSADPRSFSRGKRGISGSAIFQVFDREALLDVMRDNLYIANLSDVDQRFNQSPITIEAANSELGVDPLTGTVGVLSVDGNNRITNQHVRATPLYYDQIPPFNIVLTGFNEYGQTMKMEIRNVEIMNWGSGTSIDDINIDATCTWVATRIIPWSKQGFVDANGVFTDLSNRPAGELHGGPT